MKNKLKILIPIIAFIIILIGATLLYNNLKNSSSALPQAPEQEVQMAPDFEITNSKGETVTLSDFKGKPLVINFWASWCPPCKEEMPYLQSAFDEHGEEITFLFIDLVDGSRETKEKGEEYINSQGFTFPIYFDSTGVASTNYGIRSIPTTFFINEAGEIVQTINGSMSQETLNSGLKKLL